MELRPWGEGGRIIVYCPGIWEDLTIGESISVNGVCLTVVEKKQGVFIADISRESMNRSTLGETRRGKRVNLERALRLDSRLGGHIVQGHVDGIGTVKGVRDARDSRSFTFSHPAELGPYLVSKGSVAVDGISLTISAVGEGEFGMAAIPMTIRETNLGGMKVGDPVNLEVDIIAKYVRSFLERGLSEGRNQIDVDESFYRKLLEGGFA